LSVAKEVAWGGVSSCLKWVWSTYAETGQESNRGRRKEPRVGASVVHGRSRNTARDRRDGKKQKARQWKQREKPRHHWKRSGTNEKAGKEERTGGKKLAGGVEAWIDRNYVDWTIREREKVTKKKKTV